MNKQEFLDRLRARLSNLPEREAEEYLNFYSEMIDDRIEEGISEEYAVLEIGSVETIASQIFSQTANERSVITISKEKRKPKRRLKAWEIVLLALGSPVWLSLAIAAFAVILSLYVSLWSVIVSLWAVFASTIACAVGGILSGIVFACGAYHFSGIVMIAAGLVCAGLSIFAFCACKAITKFTLFFTKKITLTIINCFTKKEEA